MGVRVRAEALQGFSVVLGGELVILLGQGQFPDSQIGFETVRIVSDGAIEELVEDKLSVIVEPEQRFTQGDEVGWT